jgi:protein dithiol oxidoreductase (disulfide-forming)
MGNWKNLWLGAGALLACGAVLAASAPVLVEGQNFRTLATPVATESGGKVEVLEAFSYGCVHCYEFEPALRAWKAHLPADVQMSYLPATFNTNFELYARGYYAAKALGIADSTHEQVFDTIWKSGMAAQDASQLTNLYVRLGADRARFSEALTSLGVQAATSAAGVKAERLKLEGTPMLYVDGKYQVLTTGATSYDDIMQRLDAVIAKARAEHKSRK